MVRSPLVSRYQPNFMPSEPSGLTSSGVTMTTPCGHSAPTQSEVLPYALGQPNSCSRQGFVHGTGWPIVTGQCRASARVTGCARFVAGPVAGAELAAVLTGPPPVQ